MMTKLRSGQGKPDEANTNADDADADAADQSNTNMSSLQATQKDNFVTLRNDTIFMYVSQLEVE